MYTVEDIWSKSFSSPVADSPSLFQTHTHTHTRRSLIWKASAAHFAHLVYSKRGVPECLCLHVLLSHSPLASLTCQSSQHDLQT